MPRLAQSVCVAQASDSLRGTRCLICFTPQCPGSVPLARYLLPDYVSSEQDTSCLHSIPERAREGGCGQMFRNLLRDPVSALRSSVFPSANGALDGHLNPLYLAAIVAPPEETPVLLFSSCPRRRILGAVCWWGESSVGTLFASIVCLFCRLNVFPQTRLINVMALGRWDLWEMIRSRG